MRVPLVVGERQVELQRIANDLKIAFAQSVQVSNPLVHLLPADLPRLKAREETCDFPAPGCLELVEVGERNAIQRRLFDHVSFEAEFATGHQCQPNHHLASKNECKIANKQGCIWTELGTISIERLVEDNAVLGDGYPDSTRHGRWRLVNDSLRPGEQIGRPRVVDSLM